VLEVTDERGDPQPRIPGRQRDGGVLEHRGIDVERHELAQRARLGHRLQQESGLLRGAAAELDQRLAARQPRDLAGLLGQDRRLRPGEVVLGQPGDLVEQHAAALVIEVLRRQSLVRRGQAGSHVCP
jgi:hypothetical protein